MKQLSFYWNDFYEKRYLRIFRISVEKIQFSFKFDKNNGYFTYRLMYVHDNIYLNSEVAHSRFDPGEQAPLRYNG